MIVHINPEDLQHFAVAWLKYELSILKANAADPREHFDDVKEYKKDIKAVKRILAYVDSPL